MIPIPSGHPLVYGYLLAQTADQWRARREGGCMTAGARHCNRVGDASRWELCCEIDTDTASVGSVMWIGWWPRGRARIRGLWETYLGAGGSTRGRIASHRLGRLVGLNQVKSINIYTYLSWQLTESIVGSWWVIGGDW